MTQLYYDHGGIQIWHGDCRDVLSNLEKASVDFLFTDPPYGHNNNNSGDLIHRREVALGQQKHVEEARAIANDDEEANELFRNSLPEWVRILKPGCCCCCCCCGGGGPDPQFARWSLWLDQEPGLEFKQMVVWDKGPMGMGWHYRRSYETVLVAMRKGAACRWFDESDRVENIIRHIPKIIPGKKQHPTPKPEALVSHFLKLHAMPGDLVLDPFMGAGTTLVAAREFGCRAIGIEVDEKYCKMAVERLGQEVFAWSS